MRPLLIAPSILSCDFGRIAEEVRAVSDAGADLIHVDVMDGHFVPNITLGPVIVEAVKKATKKPLDVHLMIADPDRYLADFAKAGADILCVHVEASTHLHRSVQAIRALGKRAAVAINPGTPLEAVEWVLPDVSMVLVMSVNPGFGGQAFIPQAVEKIAELRAELDRRGLDVDIEVDGGVKVENVEAVARAGANVIVSGSGIFAQKDYKTTIANMRQRARLAAGSVV